MSLFAILFFLSLPRQPLLPTPPPPPTGEVSIQCKLLSGAIIRLLLKHHWNMSVSRRNFKRVGAETIAGVRGLRMHRAAGSLGRKPVALLKTSHKKHQRSAQTGRSRELPMQINTGRWKRGNCYIGAMSRSFTRGCRAHKTSLLELSTARWEIL